MKRAASMAQGGTSNLSFRQSILGGEVSNKELGRKVLKAIDVYEGGLSRDATKRLSFSFIATITDDVSSKSLRIPGRIPIMVSCSKDRMLPSVILFTTSKTSTVNSV